MKQILLSR